MAARYGRWGTGVENWKQGPKDVWVHKNNSGVRVFIRFWPNNSARAKVMGIKPTKGSRGFYEVGSVLPGRRGTIYDGGLIIARTLREARKEARRIRAQWNNPFSWGM